MTVIDVSIHVSPVVYTNFRVCVEIYEDKKNF